MACQIRYDVRAISHAIGRIFQDIASYRQLIPSSSTDTSRDVGGSHQHPVLQHSVQQNQQVDDDGFTKVTNRRADRRKRLMVTGASTSTLLRGVAAPPRKTDLFVGRLDPSTTSEAVESHINWLLGGADKVSVTEITHCVETYGYKGFKVTVPLDDVGHVLTPDKWPTHVSIKKFYQPRGSRTASKPEPTRAAQDKQLTRSVSMCDMAV